MAQSVTLTSTGNSSAFYLNPIYKETVMQVTVAASAAGTSSGTAFVQFTLDDPSITPAPSVTWANLSSAIASSAAEGIGQTLAVLSPLGGLRLSVISSTTSGIVGSGWTLKAIQSVTG